CKQHRNDGGGNEQGCISHRLFVRGRISRQAASPRRAFGAATITKGENTSASTARTTTLPECPAHGLVRPPDRRAEAPGRGTVVCRSGTPRVRQVAVLRPFQAGPVPLPGPAPG